MGWNIKKINKKNLIRGVLTTPKQVTYWLWGQNHTKNNKIPILLLCRITFEKTPDNISKKTCKQQFKNKYSHNLFAGNKTAQRKMKDVNKKDNQKKPIILR